MTKIVKKIAILIMAITILTGVFALSGCDNVSLEEYKATASQELQDYADAKGEENYCTEDWIVICKVVTDGKAAIWEATTKSAVTKAFGDAKVAIDVIDEDVSMGRIYTLQEAYGEGWLTVDDLQSIAYYHDDASMPVYPKTLNENKASKIRQQYFTIYIEPFVDEYDNFTLDDVEIAVYYGTYKGVVVIKMKELFEYYLGGEPYFVGGIEFAYAGGNKIIVWK